MRGSARKSTRNQGVKSRLKTLEKNYGSLITAGKKDEAATALRSTISAFDKAAKSGVIHKGTASRKKSRLAARLASLK
jgi:small subunit ribosomal protein S20